jgi:hypothetical protein
MPAGNAFSNVSLAILKDNVFAAYAMADDTGKIQTAVKKFNAGDSLWADAGKQPVTANTISGSTVLLKSDGVGTLFLVYRNIFGEIYAKTFDASGTLPVNLTSFTAEKKNTASLLQWATANSQDGEIFEVERRAGGQAFVQIGEVSSVKSAGGGEHNYSFTDASPAPGTNYYKLKVVDVNGRYSYSHMVNITFSSGSQPSVKLYPNPVKDVLYIETAAGTTSQITIRNAAGRMIKSISSATGKTSITVSGMPQGLYFVTVYNGGVATQYSFIK